MLTRLKNYDGACVDITYEARSKYDPTDIKDGQVDQMRRVVALETTNMSGQTVIARGAKQLFEYGDMCTIVTAVAGTGTDAGKKLTYQFNDRGNVMCVKDELGFAQFTRYSASIENTATDESKMQRAVINRLRKPDYSGEWSSITDGGTVALSSTTATRCMGFRSVAITKSNANEALYRQQVTLEQGKDWSLSAYVKTTGITDGAGDVFVRVRNASESFKAVGVSYKNLTPTVNDPDLPTDDWERLHMTFSTKNCSEPITVYVELVNKTANGTAYFACPQLEEGVVANSFNMVSNGDFRLENGGSPTDWTICSMLSGLGAATVLTPGPNATEEPCRTFPSALGGKVLRIHGAPTTTSATVMQEIIMNGSKGDVFVLGGWANAKSCPNAETTERGFRLSLKFYVSGSWEYGTNDNSKIPFNCAWVDWQYMRGVCTAPGNYTKVAIYVVYMKNINDASFTNIFVHREQFGKSFGYDSKRNVTAIGNLAGKKSGMAYDDYDNLTSYRQPGRATDDKYTMTYGSTNAEKKKHLLITSKTPKGVIERFTYDTKGNQETAKVYASNTDSFIQTATDYNDN